MNKAWAWVVAAVATILALFFREKSKNAALESKLGAAESKLKVGKEINDAEQAKSDLRASIDHYFDARDGGSRLEKLSAKITGSHYSGKPSGPDVPDGD